MSIHRFGTLPDGTEIAEIRLVNGAGATASVLTYGAALRDLVVPVAGHAPRRVVLGFRDLEGYFENSRYLGVTVGRHASRIGGGRLAIDGATYPLSLNAAGVHLHGGATGFSRRPWRIAAATETSVTLALTSPDGEDGYPGNLEVSLTYRLLEPATFALSISAVTDAPTYVSLAQHSYFTLQPGASIRSHRLRFDAERHVPFGDDMVPTGALAAVAGTPYDFRSPRPIAAEGGDPGFAYDCCMVLDHPGDGTRPGAVLEAPDRSLAMAVHTTEPCIVFYDGAGLAPDWPDLRGNRFFPHAGLCLEPMRFPDNPNQPAFPQARLDPGASYRQETEYRFAAPPGA